jgi:hypothetical protein
MNPEEIINKPRSKSSEADINADAIADATVVNSKPVKKKRSLFDLTDFTKLVGFEGIASNLSFLLFLAGLMLLYIANNHYAMKSVKKLNQSELQVKQLKWEYVNLKSELEQKSQQSYIARELEPTGIKELKQPPIKIQLSGNGKN